MRIEQEHPAPAEIAGVPGPGVGRREVAGAAAEALSRLGACVLAGVVAGLVVGGLGGRLAMMLLAVINPEATGRISDDGFRIGQLTAAGSANLLLLCALLGATGGALYNVLRPLLVGPRWFRVASLSLLGAVVVGSALVHVEGVDFRILRPVWLAIALFVAIPGLYGALVALLAERWLSGSSWLARLHPALSGAPALAVLPIVPVPVALVTGWLALHGLRALPLGRVVLGHPLAPWVARALLAGVFAVAARDLVRDVTVLT